MLATSSGIHDLDFYLFCLLPAQRDFIAHYPVFHRVLQWSIQLYFYLLPLDKAHFQDALTEAAMSSDIEDDSSLTSMQF